MAKEQGGKTHKDKVQKPISTPDREGLAPEIAAVPAELMQAMHSSAPDDQVARLKDTRMPAVQRQALATHLGKSQGNQYLTRIMRELHKGAAVDIQRQDGDVEGPSGMSTEFGSFSIYPDNFVGPLPQSVRGGESWPIRQSDFDTLITRLKQVKAGTSSLVIEGTEKFKTATLLDLGWLMTSGAGQELLADLQESMHVCTIKKIGGGNSVTGFGDGAWETQTSPPLPGDGSSCTLNYNPDRLQVGDGTEAWHKRPPAIGLAHELVHVWAVFKGTLPRGRTDGTLNAENMAVGLGDYKKVKLTENRFRSAFGLPLRPVY
jgi:hypothetical protein